MYRLEQKQILKTTMEKAWTFFSSPSNLNEITPKDLTFKIISPLPDFVYEGLMIEYRVAPIMNIPLLWVTEITHVKDKSFFVDEQRIGPYKLWHHEHHFKLVDGGVEMTDIVHFHVGMGLLGMIAEKLFVVNKVKTIFNYRRKILDDFFNK